MKKTTKAFTLVELLAVIVILAIILLIAVPSIIKIIERSKNDSYQNTVKMIIVGSKTYMASRMDSSIYDENNKLTITLQDLIDSKIFDEVNDPRW